MQKLSYSMPNFLRNAVAVAFASLLAACGGSGGSSAEILRISSKVIVEDAAIVNALVTDATGLAAIPVGRGEYRFKDANGLNITPVLPIKISSRNVIINGEIPNGVPTTFQDIDRNGEYSPGDIAFNGFFTVNYAVPGSQVVYANPIAALIPTGWSGNSAIAGLSPTILQAATSSSVESSTNKDLKQATALLTALIDSMASTLSLNGMANKQISSTVANLLLAVGGATGINLLDANAASKLGEAVAATVTASASAIPSGNVASAVSSANNLATNLQSLSVAVGDTVTNYEAIAQVAQNSPSLTTNTFNVVGGALNTVNTDLTIQNARAVAINSLRLVPFCDLVVGQANACNPAVAGPWLAFGSRLSGFKVTSQTDGSIVVDGSGPLFTDFSFISGLRAEFRSSSSTWKYIKPNVSSMEISLGVSFNDAENKVQTGNILSICNGSGDCVPYYLANESGVCGLVKTYSATIPSLLININALNAQQSSCPA